MQQQGWLPPTLCLQPCPKKGRHSLWKGCCADDVHGAWAADTLPPPPCGVGGRRTVLR